MTEVNPVPAPDMWAEKQFKREDIPLVRLHRFGSEDLHATRKLEVGIQGEIDEEGTGSFPRTTSLTLGQSDDTKSFWKGIERGESGTHSYRVYLQTKDRITVSPWNEIPLWTHDSYLRVVVKTPRGKWTELDVAMEDQTAPLQIKLRKGQLSHYKTDAPWNICLLPQTWADPELPNHNYGGLPYNGRPFEVVELSLSERKVGDVYVVKILGGFAVIDMEMGQLSWKLIAIDIEDMSAAILHDISDLHQMYPSLLEEIREWLRICHCIMPEDAEAKFGLNERAAERQAMMIEITQAHTKWQTLATSKKHMRSGKQHRRSSSSIRPIPNVNPESNETPPGVLTQSQAEKDFKPSQLEEIPRSKFSKAVPLFLRHRARSSRPAYFDSLANTAGGPDAPPSPANQGHPHGKPQNKDSAPHGSTTHSIERKHRPPSPNLNPIHGHSHNHNPGHNPNQRVLTIRTSEGIKALDGSWMGKIIIKQNRPGQDIVRRRTGAESISPRGRSGAPARHRVAERGREGLRDGVRDGGKEVGEGQREGTPAATSGTKSLARDTETGLVYATEVQMDIQEVGNIPVATALEKEARKDADSGNGAVGQGGVKVGPKSTFVPDPILIPPSRSSSSGSTNKTPSMSPPGGSPNRKSGSGKISRKVSWGWVEEVEIPSREKGKKEGGKKESVKKDGKVVTSKNGS